MGTREVPPVARRRPITIAVSGGRDYSNIEKVAAVLDWVGPVELLIHGGAPGADSLAALWAESRGVPTQVYPAEWETLGRSAGPRRNQQIADDPRVQLLVAFPGGRGTADMVSRAKEARISVLVVDSRRKLR